MSQQRTTPSLPARRKSPRRYQRLTHADIGLALKYRDEGLSLRLIGQRLGHDHSAIGQLFDSLNSTVPLAQLTARHRALEVTNAAFDGAVKAAKGKGRTDAALELIDRLEVLTKRQTEVGTRTGVQVVVNMPGQTWLKAEEIQVSPIELPQSGEGQ